MFMRILQARRDATLELRNIYTLSIDPDRVFDTVIMREQALYLRGPIQKLLKFLTPRMLRTYRNVFFRQLKILPLKFQARVSQKMIR